MSKHFEGFQEHLGRAISFFDFWLFIADQLGDSRLRINKNAGNIHQLIDLGSDHTPHLRKAIIQSYKQSRCYHLQAPIDLIAVLDILGETAYDLQGKQLDDLLDIELLEEIAWYISERFGAIIAPQLSSSGSTQRGESHKQTAACKIVSLPNEKIKRLNARF
jgi:hypothetical protein